MNHNESIPILFLAYNRPSETKRSFQHIEKIRPTKLYVSLDGPKEGDSEDIVKCKQVEEIVKQIKWPCEVRYLKQEENLGCRAGVNTALNWFFTNEEMGVIIEDDILVSVNCFNFICTMLKTYENDSNIMLVTGCNNLNTYKSKHSFHFSRIGSVWGWGSWRKAWETHDPEMKNWPDIKKSKILFKKLPPEQARHRERTGDLVYSGQISSWSYPFTITRIINDGYSIVPSKNLIVNIGFNENATHTKTSNSVFEKLSTHKIEIANIQHPNLIKPDKRFDKLLFSSHSSGSKNFFYSISQIKRLVKKFI